MIRGAVRATWMVACGVGLLGLSISGCDRGPTRYPLSGKITYGGKPIPAGWIAFEPEDVEITKETIAEGQIKDGKYRTLPGQGVIGGKHKVFVTAGNGIPEPGSPPYGASIFRATYETTVDFGQEPSTYDFDVPSSHPATPAWHALMRGSRR
ncbi:MAG: hypothetical protein ACYSWU_12135 [Planctomycetota bacterium]|jgi:hypothetical protein